MAVQCTCIIYLVHGAKENVMSDLSEKIKINVNTHSTIYMDYEPIDSVIEQLQEAHKNLTEEGYESLNLQFYNDCYCSGSCSCPPSIRIYGTRFETDEESKKRIERQAKIQADKEQYEKNQLIYLKKKYNV